MVAAVKSKGDLSLFEKKKRNKQTKKMEWRKKKMKPDQSLPLFVGGLVFFSTNERRDKSVYVPVGFAVRNSLVQ